MKLCSTKMTIVGGLLLCASVAHADPTYTTYNFHWDHGETQFFKFASNDWLAQTTTEDGWVVDGE